MGERLGALAIGLAPIVCAGAALAGPVCRVADPSGTPLNVRTVPPAGRVVMALANGHVVELVDQGRDDDGRPWVYVRDGDTGRPLGWVFRRYLDCR